MDDYSNINSVAELIQQRAISHPDYVILTYLADGENDEQSLTYQEFDRQAKLVAGYLQEKGLKGERILLLFPQGLEYMIALFGCFYAGVIAVPAYPPRNNRNLQRLQAIMQNCDAAAILTDRSGKDYMFKMEHDFSAFPIMAYEDVVSAGKTWQLHQIDGEDIAYLQYTSGSTGSPKGVIVRHINMVVNAACCHEAYPDDMACAVNWLPMFHDMGLIIMMSYILKNALCVFMSPTHFIQKPIRWLKAIEKYKGEFVIAPNFAYDLCYEKINEEQARTIDLSSLRSVVSGSERVRLDTLINFYERFKDSGFSIPIFTPCYGLAEATLVVSVTGNDGISKYTPKDAPGKVKELCVADLPIEAPEKYHVSAGRPVRGAEIQIVDPDTKEVQADGNEGEIWLHFPNSLSTGYWENEEVSQKVFYNYLAEEPGKRYLRTGDLGFMLEGEIYITGRIKDIIIIRGRNYYPNDIEFVVSQAHPALQVNSGAAFYIEEEGREQLAVVHEVRRAEWRSANPDEVIEKIRAAISEAFELSPARIVLIFPMSLPKTSSGKVQRRQTCQLMLDGKLRVMKEWKREVRVATEVIKLEHESLNEAQLLQWLQHKMAAKAKMPVEAITPDSAYNDYPLDSVEAAEMAEELSQQLGFQIEAESFWALPTIRALAEYLYEQYQAR
ncbi:MAG: AMP-binding protein [Chitinophagales bacterium]|nr:AMP-binding protein [Chitinophagales bacterium]